MFKQLQITVVVLMLTGLLVACGFQLRGMTAVSFTSIHLQGQTLSISKALRSNLEANNIKILATADNAELLLEFTGEDSEKRILSLSGGGVVREYELFYRVRYRLRGADDELWSPEQTLEARRDFSYSDAALLAKQNEETQLYENMRSDVTNNLMRRLSRYKSAKSTKDNNDATGAKP